MAKIVAWRVADVCDVPVMATTEALGGGTVCVTPTMPRAAATGTPVSHAIATAADVLRPSMDDRRVTEIRVEQQSTRGTANAVNMSYALLGLAHGMRGSGNVQVGFISATAKSKLLAPYLPAAASGTKTTYAQRKAASISAARALLAEDSGAVRNGDRWRGWFDALNKQDDASDALLLALAALRQKPKMVHRRRRILAVDVGIRSLAWCVVEEATDDDRDKSESVDDDGAEPELCDQFAEVHV